MELYRFFPCMAFMMWTGTALPLPHLLPSKWRWQTGSSETLVSAKETT
jgi:hypothetical protein